MARVRAATGIRKPYSSRATLIAKAAKQVTLFERNMAMPELLNVVILSKIYIFYLPELETMVSLAINLLSFQLRATSLNGPAI